MKSRLFLLAFLLCAFAPLREVSAAQLIRDGKLQTDLNANTNRITNATDVVTASGVSLTNLAANLGGGSGTLYRVESQVSGLGFTTPNGPTAFLTGTVATAGSFADTNSVGVIATNAVNQSTNVAARLASIVWATADSTTNSVRLTGDTLTGPLNGQTAASFFPTMRAWNSLPFVGLTDGSTLNGLRVHAHPALGGVGVLTLGAFIPSAVGPIQEFSWAGEIDSVNTVGEFWRLRHVGQDGATQTVIRMVADSALGHSAQLIISNGVFNGDGSGLTNLPIYINGGSIAQTATGAVITVTGGGGAAAISNAFVHFNLGAARNATNNGMGLGRGYLDTDTATNDIFPAFFITTSSNVVQDAYAKAWVRWPVANPTQIQLRAWYQGTTNNPLEARFSNGTNAVAYVLGAASADALNTITLTPSGFLTNVVENAAVQLRISAAFASTSSVPMGRGIEEGLWVRR